MQIMASEFRIVRRVEFAETDMAGIMHFSNFFRFMETAEHRFFRSLGHSIVTDSVEPRVGWPRVHASCDYRHPVRFEDELEVHLLVREKRSRSLRYGFRFIRQGVVPLEVAQGELVVVCVQRKGADAMEAVPIPEAIANQLEVAAPGALEAFWDWERL